MSGPQFTATPCDHCESSGIEPGTACQECAVCHDSGYGVVLPVKVPLVFVPVPLYGHHPDLQVANKPVPDPLWDPTCQNPHCIDGRRTAPIVTPCPKCGGTKCRECRNESDPLATTGFVDTGERCSWTLAPVLAERQEHHPNGEHRNGYIRIMGDGTIARHYRLDGEWEYTHPFTLPFDVSPGDWVAIPDQVTT